MNLEVGSLFDKPLRLEIRREGPSSSNLSWADEPTRDWAAPEDPDLVQKRLPHHPQSWHLLLHRELYGHCDQI
jgi:hypothetical protein